MCSSQSQVIQQDGHALASCDQFKEEITIAQNVLKLWASNSHQGYTVIFQLHSACKSKALYPTIDQVYKQGANKYTVQGSKWRRGKKNHLAVQK